MKKIGLFKPIFKKPIVLILLLSWVLPLGGVIASSVLSAPEVAIESRGFQEKKEKLLDAKKPREQVEETTEVPPGLADAPEASVEPAPQPGPPPTAEKVAVSVQPNPRTQIDINLLAQVIYAEARGEPFEGQVAVGAVLINRVLDPKFPDSLANVVFKAGEFCTVRDGQVWLSPDEAAYQAAKSAKEGWDPTGGALYFYNPVRTTSRWIWTRPVLTQIGKHLFAR